MSAAPHNLYGIFLDPTAPPTADEVVVDVPARVSQAALRQVLIATLEADPGLNDILVVVGSHEVGRTTRSHLDILFGVAERGIGDAERAGLPGESTHYRLVEFQCAQCGQRAVRSFYDRRFFPECTRGHGAMARQ